MASRAQLAQGRSRQRREELLAAAIELFAEGGTRAVTHRAVARRAGLPPATTTYYFASIEDLLREALAAHIEQWSETMQAITAVEREMAASAADVTELVRHAFTVRTPEVAARELSIFLAACKDPMLRASAAEALTAFEAFAARLLARFGAEDPQGVAASVIALIAGGAVRRQSGQYSDAEEARLLVQAIGRLTGVTLP
ncbi:TetR/AcrR family transcriptional regulator [Aeromicrobium terrae]|jgi:DNA-binding transcriptional regulator YbjK|uniref:TetR family transcriptional regulator n=1 Tax=Aeromicrobium terrae TaxID=2498846 RepID=A0A5C8NCQ0_9ACTN|nr:TetR family transcriptional regulator [Aeromicrobium terrae]TXL57272.1 TetR family transcriptional regulator [Aeromicrobium terrae]